MEIRFYVFIYSACLRSNLETLLSQRHKFHILRNKTYSGLKAVHFENLASFKDTYIRVFSSLSFRKENTCNFKYIKCGESFIKLH